MRYLINFTFTVLVIYMLRSLNASPAISIGSPLTLTYPFFNLIVFLFLSKSPCGAIVFIGGEGGDYSLAQAPRRPCS